VPGARRLKVKLPFSSVRVFLDFSRTVTS